MVKEDLSEPSPGPGAYLLPGGVATAAKGSPYRNSPAAMLSGASVEKHHTTPCCSLRCTISHAALLPFFTATTGRNKFGSPW